MKKINAINVQFAKHNGIQDMYETTDELLQVKQDTDIEEHQDSLDNHGAIGFVKSVDGDFVWVSPSMDEYEILT